MDFWDFQIRGWIAHQNQVQVMVHSSPVGGMRKPVPNQIDSSFLDKIKLPSRVDLGVRGIQILEMAKLGRALSDIILIPQVLTMLVRSLERINKEDGLRIRLCLDDYLIDLPWEFLYRPDATDEAAMEGFLLFDHRISLLRESPNLSVRLKPSQKKQRLIFAATFGQDGEDIYEVEKEFIQLSEAMFGIKDLISIDYREASDDHIEKAVMEQADIFHYAGHTNVFNKKGYLMKKLVDRDNAQWLDSSTLAVFLRRSGIRLGVFNACNSGKWEFIEPLLKAGLPAVVAIQGNCSNAAAVAFSKKLYSALAVGLSLDESVTWARLHLMEPGVLSTYDFFSWGIFMIYMPATDAVLFPRRQNREISSRQKDLREQRNQTIINVYQSIGSVMGGQVIGVSGQIPVPNTKQNKFGS